MRNVHPDRMRYAQSFPWVLFGWTVMGVLQDVSLIACSRDLDVAEIFCGVGSIWQAGTAAGYNAVGFDKARAPGVTDCLTDPSACEDILSPAGFLNAVRVVLRLKVRGLLWLAPMCNSFCFLAMSRTRRYVWNGFMGNTAVQSVVDGNLAAQAAAFLMTLAFVRGVEAVLENPQDSRMFAMFRHASVLDFCKIRCSCMRCAFDVEPDGERIWKRYIFLSFCSWVNRLSHKCRCVSKIHIRSTKKHFGKVTGVPRLLKKGGAYPPALGTEIISAWESGEALGSSGPPKKRQRRRRIAEQVSAARVASDRSGPKQRRLRRLSRQASVASNSSQILFSDGTEDDGGLVFEAAEDLGLSSPSQHVSHGAGFSALSSEVVCSGSATDLNGAGLAARSPSLHCGSSVSSNGAGLAAHSPTLGCDSSDDMEQASLHLDCMSEPGVDFSGSE